MYLYFLLSQAASSRLLWDINALSLSLSLLCSPTSSVTGRHTLASAVASLSCPPTLIPHSPRGTYVLHSMPASFSCHTESPEAPCNPEPEVPREPSVPWGRGLRTYGLPGHVASKPGRQTARQAQQSRRLALKHDGGKGTS